LFFALGLSAALPASEGASWLKIPQGARSVALGTAVSSFGQGAEALWYTPAALAGIESAGISLSRQSWLGETRDDLAAVVLPVPGGGLGAYFNWLGTNDVYRGLDGVDAGSFSNSAWAGGIGWGFRLGFLNAGVLGKVLQERFDKKQYAGYASDIGVQARLGRWLRLGGAVQNLGAWDGQGSLGGVELPLTYRGGIALDQAIPHLLLSLEARALPRSQESSVLAGAELGFGGDLWSGALRAGYEAAAARLGDLAGLNLGAGFRLGGLHADIAWSPYGALGDPYRMSLAWDFSPAAGLPPSAKPLPAELPLPPDSALAPLSQGLLMGESLEAKLSQADALLRAGKLKAAEEAFKALSEEYSANPKPYLGLFQALFRSGQGAAALDALEQKLAREADFEQRQWLNLARRLR
jgi:hypothetical protein